MSFWTPCLKEDCEPTANSYDNRRMIQKTECKRRWIRIKLANKMIRRRGREADITQFPPDSTAVHIKTNAVARDRLLVAEHEFRAIFTIYRVKMNDKTKAGVFVQKSANFTWCCPFKCQIETTSTIYNLISQLSSTLSLFSLARLIDRTSRNKFKKKDR